MLCSELTPGGMFGRMSGQRSRMNLGMAMKRGCLGVLGHTGRARQGVTSRSRSGTSALLRLVHGKLPYSLAPLPRSFPPPWAGQSAIWAVPAPVRVPDWSSRLLATRQPVDSGQCLLCPGAHLIIRPQSVRAHFATRGWLAGTYPLLLQLSPPTPRLTFLTPSNHQRLAARTLLHPSASKPADTSSSGLLQHLLSAPLSCQS